MNVRISSKAIAGRPRVAMIVLTVQHNPSEDKLGIARLSIESHGVLLQRHRSI
jgi:hypothetical protein